MKEYKKWAIICWVLSGLTFMATLLMFEGAMTKKMVFDLVLSIAWLVVGFVNWKRKDQKAE